MAKIFLKILDLKIRCQSALEMGIPSLTKHKKTVEDFVLKNYHLVY